MSSFSSVLLHDLNAEELDIAVAGCCIISARPYHVLSMRIILGMTGAGGTIYGLRLLERLLQDNHEVHLVMSPAWHQSAEREHNSPPQTHNRMTVYNPHEYDVPIASGSVYFDAMAVAPCTGSSLACIACGINQHLIHRAAEVQLKERRRLILLVRESPLSLMHAQNMERIISAGGIVQLASPHFYNAPQTVQDVVDTVIDRTISLLEFNTPNNPPPPPLLRCAADSL